MRSALCFVLLFFFTTQTFASEQPDQSEDLSSPRCMLRVTEAIENSDFYLVDKKIVSPYLNSLKACEEIHCEDETCVYHMNADAFNFPNEVLLTIVSSKYLNYKDILSFLSTCKYFYHLLSFYNKTILEKRWNIVIDDYFSMNCELIFSNASCYRISITAVSKDFDGDKDTVPETSTTHEIRKWNTGLFQFSDFDDFPYLFIEFLQLNDETDGENEGWDSIFYYNYLTVEKEVAHYLFNQRRMFEETVEDDCELRISKLILSERQSNTQIRQLLSSK